MLSAIHAVVYDSRSLEEFEHGWSEMIRLYTLQENDWLYGLYKDRSRWVPRFLKTSFWAGTSTTQCSESMNAFFDGYVHAKTSLKQFVEQYEHALRSKVEKEFQADFRSFSQMVPYATKYDMEKQFQEVYTISKFREFQEEFTAKVYCELRYDQMCIAFTKVADDEERTQEIMEWIEFQSNDLSTSKSRQTCGINNIEAEKNSTGNIMNPTYKKTKGAPKKLR
ncbi:Protein FAR1-RELATED SEQUENCE 5 [Abeliophyllum distichum]|uniref:Protein FAR1-RELATED SEQUENCE n=1 Tax=Abeliophyllum distichum TaxID=126358 RepID=A0ABD1P8V1_9LAMI